MDDTTMPALTIDEKNDKISRTELKKALQILTAAIEAKNQVSIYEFHQFIPLFQRPTETTNLDTIKELSREFQTKFDLFRTIIVYDIDPQDPAAKILFALPPIFSRLKLITETSDRATRALQGYINALTAPANPLSMNKEIATQRMINVTTPILKDEESLQIELAKLEKLYPVSTKLADKKAILDDMVWE